MRSNSCPECQGSMVEGFIVGESQGIRTVTAWAVGAGAASRVDVPHAAGAASTTSERKTKMLR